MKPKSSKLVSAFSELIKKFLERFKNFDLQNICLMIVGVEGEVDNVNFQKKKVFKIGTSSHISSPALSCVVPCACVCVCVCVCVSCRVVSCRVVSCRVCGTD
jgi:hypothetical protein